MTPLGTFSDGEPAVQLRGLAFLALSDVGHLSRGTVVDDAGGGGSVTEVLSGTIPCRIDPLSGGERDLAGRISERSTHVLSVPAGTDLSARDRFVIDGRGTFEVTATRQRSRGWVQRFEVLAP